MVPYPSGKGQVCKTSIHRFESGRHLLGGQLAPFLVEGVAIFEDNVVSPPLNNTGS
jgi:hypothetical protein